METTASADAAGFALLPSVLSAQQQLELALAAWQKFTQPPARTNHAPRHGPLPDLWEAAAAGLHWVPVGGACDASGQALLQGLAAR
jgi:hypothetical protein